MHTRIPQARLAVALDHESLDASLALAAELAGVVTTLKIGPRLFVTAGPKCVERVRSLGFDVFLDLKFHDIPETVAGACRAATRLGVRYLTIHTEGGSEMIRRAVAATREIAAETGDSPPTVLGITVLTSLELPEPDGVLVRARAGRDAGIGGLVASAREVAAIREVVGPELVLVTPGIRPVGAAAGDQARVSTPGQAIAGGSDLLVVGRPILNASNPRAVAQALVREISDAGSS